MKTTSHAFLVFSFLLTILMVILICLHLPGVKGTTITVDDDGGKDYTTIQEAIDNAKTGDTIEVAPGNYMENLFINKTLSLKGNGTDSTFIDGLSKADVILVEETEDVLISGFSIIVSTGHSNKDGIVVITCENIEISGNLVVGHNNGIYFHETPGARAQDNELVDNDYGIQFVSNSDGAVAENNTLTDTLSMDIVVRKSENCGVWNNQGVRPIFLTRANHNTVSHNTITGGGIRLEGVRNNAIVDNEFFQAEENGIYLYYYCRFNNFRDNICQDALESGIYIEESVTNTFTGHTISGNGEHGVHLWRSGEVTLEENTFSGNDLSGVFSFESETLVMKSNTMEDGGVLFEGQASQHWNSHDIDTQNTVGGSPIHYLSFQDGVEVPAGAGQIILVNCSDIQVSDQECSQVAAGIQAAFSSELELSGCTVEETLYGIYLYRGQDIEISSNVLDSRWAGIYLNHSREADISGNKLTGGGIYIDDNDILGWSSHEVEDDNALNKKPLVFLKGVSNDKVPENAGQVILVDCSGMMLDELDCSNTSTGLLAFRAPDTIVREGIFSWNHFAGILFRDSPGVRMEEVACERNGGNGISFTNSSDLVLSQILSSDNLGAGLNFHFVNDSTLTDLKCHQNTRSGLIFQNSSGNTIEGATVYGNLYGVYLFQNASDNYLGNSSFTANLIEGLHFAPGCHEITIFKTTVSWHDVGVYFAEDCKQALLDNNNFFKNRELAIESEEDVVNARENWWDDESGPYHKDNNPSGKGDTVSDNVDFDEWLTFPLDAKSPTVISSFPVEGNETMEVNEEFKIKFDYFMNRYSFVDAITCQPSAEFALSWEKNTLNLRPFEKLKYDTSYTLTILGIVSSAEGWAMGQDFVLHFRTGPMNLNPEVLFLWPTSESEGVPVDPKISILFSEPMNRRSVMDGLEASFAFELEWDEDKFSTQLYITPNETLLYETEYYIDFSPKPTDKTGKPLMGWRDLFFTSEELTMTIEEPDNWEEVSGEVQVSGFASPLADKVEVGFLGENQWFEVDLFLGGYLGDDLNSGEWKFALDSTKLENKEYTLQARCIAGDQFSGYPQVVMTVVNNAPPEIVTFSIGSGRYEPGAEIPVSAEVDDPNGEEDIRFIKLELYGPTGSRVTDKTLPVNLGVSLDFETEEPLLPGNYQLVLVVEDRPGARAEKSLNLTIAVEEDSDFVIAGINGFAVLGGTVVVLAVVSALVVVPKLKGDQDEEDEDEEKEPKKKTKAKKAPVKKRVQAEEEDEDDEDDEDDEEEEEENQPAAEKKKMKIPKTVVCPKCKETATFQMNLKKYKCGGCGVLINIKKK